MANDLVVHKDRLPQSQKMRRAAQYVRVSTEYQKYSTENQAAVIAAYAQVHGLTITCTYRDEGESGLQIKNRVGLTQLIKDVEAGHADFSHLLVFDVSRWGRFQDIDESAHYEFLCKQAGIRVAYCAEDFDNDGSLISSIVKNIKRVMAAEFSRELSVKVHAGQSTLARLGYKMGGPLGYGLERVAVDENSHPIGILKHGDRKYLTSHHVKVRPGSTDERAVVRWIFKEFVGGKRQATIIRELNRRGIMPKTGHLWTENHMHDLLRNEVYIGNLIWNRSSQKLGGKLVANPAHLWIRSEACVEPIIDRALFAKAKKILDEYRLRISEEEMLARLRKVLMRKGGISATIINKSPTLPCCATYLKHFGSLQNIYQLIGYNQTRYWDDLETHRRWLDENLRHVELLRHRFEQKGNRVSHDPYIQCLRIDDSVNICFGLAKWRKYPGRDVRWTLRKQLRQPAGWIVAIRLGEKNQAILDYLLLSSAIMTSVQLWFSEDNRSAREIERFETIDELVRSLVSRVSGTLRPRLSK
jgi:DNA invertase Pin-like site-specific DNA recombinase